MTFPNSFGIPIRIVETGQNYTVSTLDDGKVIRFNTTSAMTLYLPKSKTVPNGFVISIMSMGGGGSVTVDYTGDQFDGGTATQYVTANEILSIMNTSGGWITVYRNYIGSVSSAIKIGRNTTSSTTASVAIGDSASATTSNSISIGNSATSSGTSTIAVGTSANASGSLSVALGPSAVSSGSNSTALGNSADATSSNSTAIGRCSAGAAQAVTGDGATALGGAYASGTDSLAAVNADVSGTYGAKGSNSIAIGYRANVTSTGSVSIGYSNSTTGSYGISLGKDSVSSIYGKFAYSSGAISASGDNMMGMLVLKRVSNDATSVVLTSNNGSASTSNQVVLSNNTSITFNALITARELATGDTAAWNVSGCIKRGAGVGATTLVGSVVSLSSSADTNASTWTVVCSADTTNGALAITATGQAAKTIRWSATVYTNELTG